MRRILLSTIKILISAALLYLALRKANFADLASRIDVASLGWIGLAIAVSFLQIFVGVLRWCEVSAECGAPLATKQAMRFNVIGTFFNQTLPSSIGGDAVRLLLVARAGAGWRAATYSIFVDRAIGLIALAIIIVASLPVLVHVLAVFIAWCVVQSIGAPVTFGQIFQLIPPVMLITMLPISIAGWGVREATMGLAFGYAGLMTNEG